MLLLHIRTKMCIFVQNLASLCVSSFFLLFFLSLCVKLLHFLRNTAIVLLSCYLLVNICLLVRDLVVIIVNYHR